MRNLTTRRGFIVGAIYTAGLFGVGAVAKASHVDTGAIRPPGGQWAGFAACCLKCDRCRSICPQSCISVAQFESGLLDARTPVMDFQLGYCDFCGLCVEVCPTGALLPFDSHRDKIGVAQIDVEKCLAYSQGSCNRCFDVCEFEALVVSEKGFPSIDPAVCNGCGECVAACTSNVFGAFGGDQKRAVEVHSI